MRAKNSSALSYIQKHSFVFTAIIIAGFVNSCISFLLTVSIGEFFSLFFQTDSSKARLLARLGLHMDSVTEFFIIFFSLLVIRSIISYFENLETFRLSELYVRDLREKVFTAQMKWEPDEFSNGGYGKYLLRYSNDLKSVQNYFSLGIMGGIKNFLFLLAGLLVLSGIHLKITFILLLLLVFVIATIYTIAALQIPLITMSRSRRSSLLAFVAKSLSGFPRIKTKQSEPIAIRRFMARSENLYLANMRSNRIESLIQISTFFLIFVMLGVLLWQMTMPYISISALDGLTIVLIIMMMHTSLNRILRVPGYLNKGRISLKKIEAVLLKENIAEDNNEIISEQMGKDNSLTAGVILE